MVKIDQGIESSELIECEIDCLMRRLAEVDPDALHKIERLVSKIRVECAVERAYQRQA